MNRIKMYYRIWLANHLSRRKYRALASLAKVEVQMWEMSGREPHRLERIKTIRKLGEPDALWFKDGKWQTIQLNPFENILFDTQGMHNKPDTIKLTVSEDGKYAITDLDGKVHFKLLQKGDSVEVNE